jgi:hypothetical protein
MASTESTISGVSCSASELSSLVESEVRATERRSSRSTSFASLNSSRNWLLSADSSFRQSGRTHLQCLRLRDVVTVGDDARMEALGNVSVRLLQKLSDEQND